MLMDNLLIHFCYMYFTNQVEQCSNFGIYSYDNEQSHTRCKQYPL